jgi:hypothetical protein
MMKMIILIALAMCGCVKNSDYTCIGEQCYYKQTCKNGELFYQTSSDGPLLKSNDKTECLGSEVNHE